MCDVSRRWGWIESYPRLHRLARRLVPGKVWDGAGEVVDKTYREPYTGDALVVTGRGMAYGSASTEERWVLIVRDPTGEDHFVNVDREVWDAHDIGASVTAASPLVAHP